MTHRDARVLLYVAAPDGFLLRLHKVLRLL
jgi:hypothetical protein